jgi:hypothetical protein
LIEGDETDWALVVPATGLAEGKGQFAAWCAANRLDPGSLAPEDVRIDVGRKAPTGSFVRYFVRRSALTAAGVRTMHTSPD